VLSERLQHQYPQALCDMVEGLFTVENPKPKRGAATLARDAVKAEGIRVRDLARDLWALARTYG